jgi:hypothetical protein
MTAFNCAILAYEAGASVALTPLTELRGGYGVTQIEDFLESRVDQVEMTADRLGTRRHRVVASILGAHVKQVSLPGTK